MISFGAKLAFFTELNYLNLLPIFEVCLQSPTDALAAQAGGARRVELCAALVEGGLTPSRGCLKVCRDSVTIDIMAMIRPRGGDFYYNQQELDSMAADVADCKAIGITGVVFGLLQTDGKLDMEPLRQLISLAKPLQITFHRAFDVCQDPFEALEQLIELGVDRVLTSGQAATVPEGLALIQALVEKAQGRILILPGGGIKPTNVQHIVSQTGVSEFHATAFKQLESPMQFRNEKVYMGTPGLPEYERLVTDAAVVRSFLAAF